MQVNTPPTQFTALPTAGERSLPTFPEINDPSTTEENTQRAAISTLFFKTISQPQFWQILVTTACCTFATLTLLSCCTSKQNE
jgi:hypothetical protein